MEKVIEKEITFTFDPKDVAMILLSAFYVFTMHYNYTEGCTNFYSALEALLLNQKTPNRKTCSNLLAILSSKPAAILSRLENM